MLRLTSYFNNVVRISNGDQDEVIAVCELTYNHQLRHCRLSDLTKT